jgi:leucyl-tRNA synthetase
MELTKELYKVACKSGEALEFLINLLQPLAPPHRARAVRFNGNTIMIADAGWPEYKEEYCAVEEVEFGVMVNGKSAGRELMRWTSRGNGLGQSANTIDAVMKQIEGRAGR